jgi:hypothetical protein
MLHDALHVLRARVRPPGNPLPQIFHVLFPGASSLSLSLTIETYPHTRAVREESAAAGLTAAGGGVGQRRAVS